MVLQDSAKIVKNTDHKIMKLSEIVNSGNVLIVETRQLCENHGEQENELRVSNEVNMLLICFNMFGNFLLNFVSF